MKFTCDSCGAQYMISDDKVGPNGVKVRCKKCQNVVLVRKASEPSPAPVAAHVPAGANGSAEGLDAELGHAFDSMLGGAAPSASPPPDPEPERTQLMSKEDAAKIGASAKTNGVAASAAGDWYVAIADAQVGPLPLSDVKRKWEAGEIGPDSLVWRPGMGDWASLSTVGDLASALAPVPQPSRARPAPSERSSSTSRAAAASAAAQVAPREEPTWKPAAASALAALATEEIATRGPQATPAAAPRNTAKSLVEQMNLPDAGGVDPTGAIPLPIKGMEPSPAPQAKRRTSVARGAAEVRHRRSILRGVALGAIAVVLLAGGGAAGMLWYTGRFGGSSESLASVASAQPAPAAPAPAAPAPKAPPPVAAAPAPQPAPPAPVAAAPAPAPERKAAQPPPAPKPEPVRVARADPAPRPARTERRVSRPEPEPVREEARAPEREPEPPPAPAPAASRKKDSVLDFDGGGSDRALEEALGGTPSGRSVYVPPRPGSDLPDHLSASQINEAVLTQVDSLRRCVSEQKSRDADASGTLKMRWIIQGDGAVRDVKCLTPEFASGPFAQCISGVVRTIRFPKSSTKGQEVTFPFTF